MGATTFRTRASGEDVGEAFRAAVERAKFEHGHGGYTGTIAEKTSFTVIPQSEFEGVDPVTYADHLISEGDERVDSKWGPAGAIELGEGEYLFFGWASL